MCSLVQDKIIASDPADCDDTFVPNAWMSIAKVGFNSDLMDDGAEKMIKKGKSKLDTLFQRRLNWVLMESRWCLPLYSNRHHTEYRHTALIRKRESVKCISCIYVISTVFASLVR